MDEPDQKTISKCLLKFQKEDIDDVARVTALILKNPNNSGPYYQRGFAYTLLHQYEDAIPDLEKVIVLNPNHIDARESLAGCYTATEKFKEATEQYQILIDTLKSMDFSDMETKIRLKSAQIGFGNICRALQQYDSALEAYNQALETIPNDAVALFAVLELHEEQEDLVEALATIERIKGAYRSSPQMEKRTRTITVKLVNQKKE